MRIAMRMITTSFAVALFAVPLIVLSVLAGKGGF